LSRKEVSLSAVFGVVVCLMLMITACHGDNKTLPPSATTSQVNLETTRWLSTLTVLPAAIPSMPPPNKSQASAPPSPTPLPSPTRLPSLTGTSTPVLPTLTQTVYKMQGPPLTHDLVFLSGGRLRYWDHAFARIETLVGPEITRTQSQDTPEPEQHLPLPGYVNQFTTSLDGKKIALAFTKPDSIGYRIASIDMDTRKINILNPEIAQGAGLLAMQITPNGEWVAFVLQDTGTGMDKPLSGIIYAVKADDPSQVIQVGVCSEYKNDEGFHKGCHDQLFWLKDNRTLIWADGLGIWRAELGQPARQLVAHHLSYEKISIFFPISLSPGEKYILADYADYLEGRKWAVLDINTGEFVVVPDSYRYIGEGPGITWLQDDWLMIVQPDGALKDFGNPSLPAAGIIWALKSGPSLAIVKMDTFELCQGASGYVRTPAQLANGDLAYFQAVTLCVHSSKNFTVKWKVELPYVSPDKIAWAPDSNAAIVESDSHIYYLPTGGSSPWEITSLVGEDACCFTWLL
jgi:hypothetical protein